MYDRNLNRVISITFIKINMEFDADDLSADIEIGTRKD